VLAGYREAMALFADLAPPQWQGWLDTALTGESVLTTQRVADEIARTPLGSPLVIDVPQWIDTTGEHITRLHQVERQVDGSIWTEVSSLYRGQLAWVVAEAVVVVIALMVAVVMAIGQSRSMIRRLRALTNAARSTAFVSLPALVERLRAIGNQTVDPEAFANQAEAPAPDRGGDEIADVSRAFASVHRQAIRTAAELANMRAGVSQIFLHLARRNQRLVGVLMRELDGAERDERDPDRLATLFRLDQLATRMGRYNDNLLVVGGQTASRVDAPDASLHTVLRGAQSKVEHYRRIDVNVAESNHVVRGSAVHDVINLLAELLENATHFSPPESLVSVTAVAGAGGVVVRILDAGVGIPPWRVEPINEALASPPAIDISAVRSMGLTVVAHIAARHGISVRVRPGPRSGTLVEVSLPPTVCGTAQPYAQAQPSVEARPPAQARPAGPGLTFSWFHANDGAARSGGLRGAADAGWAAAQRAASHQASAAMAPTGAGLPRRPPMANLVPGAVPDGLTGAGAVDQRDPGLVAASVAAFALGNAHSRALHAPDPSTPQEHR
jgi:signal transduction histidine kinase